MIEKQGALELYKAVSQAFPLTHRCLVSLNMEHSLFENSAGGAQAGSWKRWFFFSTTGVWKSERSDISLGKTDLKKV